MHVADRAGNRRRRIARVLAVVLGIALLGFGSHAVLVALYPFPFRPVVQQSARAAGLDPRLVLAVMRTESKFDPASTSREDARGLMQIVPETGAWIAARRGESGSFAAQSLYQPAVNISYGSWYLGELQREFGQTAAALAAYNAGRSHVETWLRDGTWSGGSADIERIPYPETRRFVAHVLRDWSVYRWLYPRN